MLTLSYINTLKNISILKVQDKYLNRKLHKFEENQLLLKIRYSLNSFAGLVKYIKPSIVKK